MTYPNLWDFLTKDFLYRILSRKFLCVVFFFLLIVIGKGETCFPVIGCVGPLNIDTIELALFAIVTSVFIIMEGKTDKARVAGTS